MENALKETLRGKWRRHYKSGGFFYAFYRGIKYIIWRIKSRRKQKKHG